MSIYGGKLVARTLKSFGVEHLFSLPGHQTLSVFDACLDEKIDLVSTRHEASAVFMAQGMAFANRQPGVALLAGGPELTNALTAIAQAYHTSTPLVIVSGSNTYQKRDRGFPQDMDQLELVRPFTKWARCCHDIRRIPEYLATAYRQALRGRPGPVYVEIPYDILESKIGAGEVVIPPGPLPLRACGENSSLDAMVALLAQARRPVAIAGSGAFWSSADAELQSFIERTHIPLFLSNAALALPFPPELVFGLGYLGVTRVALEAISEADLILLLGKRINYNLGFGQAPFISEGQKIVQIDVEPEEIDANRRVDLGIQGDLKVTLARLNTLPLVAAPLDAWRDRLRQKTAGYAEFLHPIASSTRLPVHPYRLVTELEALRQDDSMLVLDGANSILWALLALKIRARGGALISSMGELEAIGSGVPLALALKRAQPGRQVILHTGDGALGYGLIEMETAVRYGIPIVVVVHNDVGWGMTRDMQQEFFGAGRQIGNQLGVVRYDRLVQAFGGYGELVEQPDEIRPAVARALQSGLPACVNVLVDPEPKSPGLMTFFMMEVMLGKQTYLDRLPGWMRRLHSLGLDGPANLAILAYLKRKLHSRLH